MAHRERFSGELAKLRRETSHGVTPCVAQPAPATSSLTGGSLEGGRVATGVPIIRSRPVSSADFLLKFAPNRKLTPVHGGAQMCAFGEFTYCVGLVLAEFQPGPLEIRLLDSELPKTPPELEGEDLAQAEFLMAREGHPTRASVAALSPAEHEFMLEEGAASARNERLQEISGWSPAYLKAEAKKARDALDSEMKVYLPKLPASDMETYGQALTWSLEQALALSLRYRPVEGLLTWLERNWTLKPELGRMMSLLRLMQIGVRTGALTDPVAPITFLEWLGRIRLETDPVRAPPTLVQIVREALGARQLRQAVTGETLLPTDEVAKRVGVHRNTLNSMVERGEIPAPVWVGGNKRWRESEVSEWMSGLPRKAPDSPG